MGFFGSEGFSVTIRVRARVKLCLGLVGFSVRIRVKARVRLCLGWVLIFFYKHSIAGFLVLFCKFQKLLESLLKNKRWAERYTHRIDREG